MTMPKCREPHLSDSEEGVEPQGLLLMESCVFSLLGRALDGKEEECRGNEGTAKLGFFPLRKISS